MPTDYSENSYDECRTYIEDLRQRLAGRSVPRPEMIALFHEVIARIAQAYQEELVGANVHEYQAWADEDLIAGAIAMAELRRCWGLQRGGWEGLAVVNHETTFEVTVDLDDVVDLYLQRERNIEHVLLFISATFSWAIMRGVVGERAKRPERLLGNTGF